jgi:hypothetical protein
MKIKFERNRTSIYIVMYSLYLYFLGLSLRNTSKALLIFRDDKRSYVSVWNWFQRFVVSNLQKKREYLHLLLTKLLLKLVTSISGYGFA